MRECGAHTAAARYKRSRLASKHHYALRRTQGLVATATKATRLKTS